MAQQTKQRDMSAAVEEWPVQVGRPDEGRRVDRVLAERLRFRSRSQHGAAIAAGNLRVYSDWQRSGPGVVVRRPAQRVRAGQLLVLELAAPFVSAGDRVAASLEPERILYEDEHVLAVDKPNGCSVYPNRRHRSGSLLERIHRTLRERGESPEALPTPCHRLDRETSGLLLLAKTAVARASLGAQFERKSQSGKGSTALRKIYVAVVQPRSAEPGQPWASAPRRQTIDMPLGPDPRSTIPLKRTVVSGGERAVSEWAALEQGCNGKALVQLEPITGRQHQLRVHAAAIGFPMVGDALYRGGDAVFLRSLEGSLTDRDRELLGASRLALHASRLRFWHPTEERTMWVESPAPFSGWLDEEAQALWADAHAAQD